VYGVHLLAPCPNQPTTTCWWSVIAVRYFHRPITEGCFLHQQPEDEPVGLEDDWNIICQVHPETVFFFLNIMLFKAERGYVSDYKWCHKLEDSDFCLHSHNEANISSCLLNFMAVFLHPLTNDIFL
jgi:hypothetical protein